MAQWQKAEHKQQRVKPLKKKQDELGDEDRKVRPVKKKWTQKDLEDMSDDAWDEGEFDAEDYRR